MRARVGVVAGDALDLARRAEDERHALVQAARARGRGCGSTVRWRAAGLLDQEGDRVGLVDQPQPALAVAAALVAGIEEHAAAHQDAVGLGDQRGDPAHVEVLLARAFGALQAVVDIEPHGLVPVPVVRGVDGEFLGARAAMHPALVSLDEGAQPRREHEDMRAAAERQHQRQLRPVDEEAGAELVHPGLQKSGGRIGIRRASCREEREDRADRQVGVDVGGAVERIDGEGQRRGAVEQHRLLQFLGRIERDRRMPHGVEEDVVGEDVEILLVVAVGIGAARTGEGGAQRAVVDGVADLDRCLRELRTVAATAAWRSLSPPT